MKWKITKLNAIICLPSITWTKKILIKPRNTLYDIIPIDFLDDQSVELPQDMNTFIRFQSIVKPNYIDNMGCKEKMD